MAFNGAVRTKLVAVTGVGLLLLSAAVVNSRRAEHQRSRNHALPAPSVPAPVPLRTPNIYGLNCDDWPGQGTSEEANTPLSAPGHQDLAVVSVRCTDSSGERHPSLVHVIDLDDDRRIVATLIRPQQYLHVLAVRVSGSVVTVTASEAARVADGDQKAASDLGSVFARTFTAGRGAHFTESDPTRLAFACSPSDLRLAVAAIGTPTAGQGSVPPSIATLSLTNFSDRACAVEGYPSVAGVSAGGALVNAHTELSGPSGRGVQDSTAPPVVVLDPGQTASAAMDSADETPAGGPTLCTTLVTVRIGLPTGEPVGRRPIDLRVCDFQVHPFVPGTSGRSG
ncbi:MAG: hypothetical protein QOH56_1252 [Pseudonocardiales bacterium]|nr:hypothetical protein [Pseudonocardiales bacterium]